MSSTHPYAAFYHSSPLENKETHVYPHHHPQPNLSSPPPISQPLTRTPSRLYHPILFFAYCTLPPVISLLDLTIGHAVLRYPPSILSSVQAGASGGAILSLPIALLLYLLFASNKRPDPATPSPEDFFEDDSTSFIGISKLAKCAPWAVLALLVLLIGTIAGPLGTTILHTSRKSRTLSPSQAAIAGIVGSATLLGFFLLLFAMGSFLWFRWKQNTPTWRARR